MTPDDRLLQELSGYSRSALFEALGAHSNCEIDDNLILLKSLNLVVTCKVSGIQDLFGSLKMTPINIVLGSLNKDFQPIGFDIAGLGKSPSAAIENGVSQWVDGAVPSVKAAFSRSGEDAPGVFVGEIGHYDPANPPADTSACWRMYLGQYTIGVIGHSGGQQLLADQLERQHLISLLRPSLSALHHIDRDVNYCWLKLYLARRPDGEAAGECSLNEDVLEGGVDALRRFTWPDFSPIMAFVRQYAIFKRIPCEELGEPPQGVS